MSSQIAPTVPPTRAPSADPLRKLYTVFLSYSSKDLPLVRECREVLKSGNIDVFFADASVVEGERLSDKIHRAIRGCDKFVLMWSERAKQSGWVQQEIGAALSQGKTILPIVLDGTDLPDMLKDVKYLPADTDFPDALERLIAETEADRKSVNYLIGGALILWAMCAGFRL